MQGPSSSSLAVFIVLFNCAVLILLSKQKKKNDYNLLKIIPNSLNQTNSLSIFMTLNPQNQSEKNPKIFAEFYGNSFLSDCTLILPDGKRIRSHRLVLGSSSVFFDNAFNSDMKEHKTHEVKIYSNPGGLFEKVVEFMYTGTTPLPEISNCMIYLYFADFYGIESLVKAVDSVLEKAAKEDPNSLIQCINQCVKNQFLPQLDHLCPYIADNLDRINGLTNVLDVGTFAKILSIYKKKNDSNPQEIMDKLKEFVGHYQFEEEDKQNLYDAFSNDKNMIDNLYKSFGEKWLPPKP